MAVVTSSSDGIYEGPRCGEFRVHVRDLTLHELECSNRLVELATLMNIIKGIVEGCLHDPQRSTAQHQTLEIQPGHEDCCAIVYRSQYIFW